MRNNFTGAYTLFLKETHRIIRIWPQTFFSTSINIILYLIIFGNLIGPMIGGINGFNYIQYILPGLIMMAIVNNSYTNVTWSLFTSKFQRNIEEILVSPLSNNEILLGYVAGGIFRGIIVGILVLIIATLFVNLTIYNIAITCMTSLLAALLFSVAGFLNGIFAKTFDDLTIFPNYVLLPLTYVGGVFYSIDMLPDFCRTLTWCNPIFYLVNSLRYGMLGISDVDIRLSMSALVVFIIILYKLTLNLMHENIHNYDSVYFDKKQNFFSFAMLFNFLLGAKNKIINTL